MGHQTIYPPPPECWLCGHVQWVMINRLVRLMWPKLTAAILSEVIAQGKPIVQDQLGKVRWSILACCSHGHNHDCANGLGLFT